MKNTWGILALVVTITFSPAVNAAELTNTFIRGFGKDVGWLGLNKEHKFEVKIIDRVKDGCWTNSNSVKTAVESELKRSGYKLADEYVVEPVIVYIHSVGYAIDNRKSCIVSYELDIQRMLADNFSSVKHHLRSWVYASLWTQSGVMNGPKNGINRKLKDNYVDLMQSFLSGIAAEKKAILEEIARVDYVSSEARAYWSSYEID
ncbi:MAG: hypothetical protein ACERLB_09625 [Gammaproteobacteria bacterium]